MGLERYLDLQLLLCAQALVTSDNSPNVARLSWSYSACKEHACLVHLPVVPCPVNPVGPCGPVLPATPQMSVHASQVDWKAVIPALLLFCHS